MRLQVLDQHHLRILPAGGDAFLTTPVNDVQLIASITNRAERSRMVRSLMMRDGLTGFLDHSNIKEQLGLEVNRAARTSAIFSFAMLDSSAPDGTARPPETKPSEARSAAARR